MMAYSLTQESRYKIRRILYLGYTNTVDMSMKFSKKTKFSLAGAKDAARLRALVQHVLALGSITGVRGSSGQRVNLCIHNHSLKMGKAELCVHSI